MNLLTNEYYSIEELYLAYIVECEMLEEMEIPNIIRFIEDLQGSYTILGEYLSKSEIIRQVYQCKKYEEIIENFLLDGTNLTYLMQSMELEEQVELLQIVFDTKNEERISHKDSVASYIRGELQSEVSRFLSDRLEEDLSLDEIVASEIEDLKIEFEYEERKLLSPIFKEELLQRVEASFREVCVNHIDEAISDIYIELVFDTPEEDYSYYKKYLFEKYEINRTQEEIEIHNIFRENTKLKIT